MLSYWQQNTAVIFSGVQERKQRAFRASAIRNMYAHIDGKRAVSVGVYFVI